MAEPREYDREYRKPLPGPLQIRIGQSSQKGTITRFVVQLEYWLDGEWRQVVRYDHDPDAPMKWPTTSGQRDSTSTCTATK